MGIGAFRAFTGEFMGGLWLVLIGLFLRQAAEGSYQQVVLRRALGPLAVRDVMTRAVVQVPADLPVGRCWTSSSGAITCRASRSSTTAE